MKDLLGCIGNTPYLYVDGIFVKCEHLNPSGSTKDRIAKYMILEAERQGKLKPGMEVIEATSGNSGIAFAMVCAFKGYKMNVIMPEGLTNERIHYMKAYNANIIITPKKDGVMGALDREREMAKNPKYFSVDQFTNESNVDAHGITLGMEIRNECKHKLDAFVAGVGTGGTLFGAGDSLKSKWPGIKLFAVEPAESPVLQGGVHHEHKIEGIGDGFIPEIYKRHRDMVDGIIEITSQNAINESKRLARNGLMVGISSGANILAAKQLQKKYEHVATVFPDGGERYFSMGIYDKFK